MVKLLTQLAIGALLTAVLLHGPQVLAYHDTTYTLGAAYPANL